MDVGLVLFYEEPYATIDTTDGRLDFYQLITNKYCLKVACSGVFIDKRI